MEEAISGEQEPNLETKLVKMTNHGVYASTVVPRHQADWLAKFVRQDAVAGVHLGHILYVSFNHLVQVAIHPEREHRIFEHYILYVYIYIYVCVAEL